MTTLLNSVAVLRRPDLGRRIVGSLGELAVKAYGAAAVISVAFSDAETVGGKVEDAVAAVPNLMERYRDVKYVAEHREELQGALDYVDQNAPDAEQLLATAEEGSRTLDDLDTTIRELDEAREALADVSFGNAFDTVREVAGHLVDAGAAIPDLDSLRLLTDAAEDLAPFVAQADVLGSRVYESLLLVADNFASDEVATTLLVMAASFVVAYLVGAVIGFWGRRGLPGFVARTLQAAGARVYRGWYVRHAAYALTPPVYEAARERFQRDLVADPQQALDAEAFVELERYFRDRR
ncbi:hypothetical protein [Nocardioides sp. SYSU DS0663]|uniref:hypothetical protein n=1 Tax=Nocardioides sp. SYSU DS0663 TaxID=3416445 RepID=UPI003F4B1402